MQESLRNEKFGSIPIPSDSFQYSNKERINKMRENRLKEEGMGGKTADRSVLKSFSFCSTPTRPHIVTSSSYYFC